MEIIQPPAVWSHRQPEWAVCLWWKWWGFVVSAGWLTWISCSGRPPQSWIHSAVLSPPVEKKIKLDYSKRKQTPILYDAFEHVHTAASCSRSSRRVAVVERSQLYFFFMFSCIFFILSWASLTSAKNYKEGDHMRWTIFLTLWIWGMIILEIYIPKCLCSIPGSRLCFLWDEPLYSSTVGGSSSTESAGQLWRTGRDQEDMAMTVH